MGHLQESSKDGIPYKERGSGQELEEALLCSQSWLLSRLLWKWRGKYIPKQRIQEEIFGLSFEICAHFDLRGSWPMNNPGASQRKSLMYLN